MNTEMVRGSPFIENGDVYTIEDVGRMDVALNQPKYEYDFGFS